MPKRPAKRSGKALLPATVVSSETLADIDRIVEKRRETDPLATRADVVREMLVEGARKGKGVT